MRVKLDENLPCESVMAEMGIGQHPASPFGKFLAVRQPNRLAPAVSQSVSSAPAIMVLPPPVGNCIITRALVSAARAVWTCCNRSRW